MSLFWGPGCWGGGSRPCSASEARSPEAGCGCSCHPHLRRFHLRQEIKDTVAVRLTPGS